MSFFKILHGGRRLLRVSGALLLVVAVLAGLLLAAGTASAGETAKKRVLVGFASVPGPEERAVLRGLGGQVKREFRIVRAAVVDLPEVMIAQLRKSKLVRYVEPDAVVRKSGESIPWGVARIKAPDVWSTTTGAGVKVAVLDTGIDPFHEDLSPAGGYNAFDGSSNYADGDGHGTHVSGTVAALLQNGVGVAGVSPSVSLYAVKVLDDSGYGTISSVVTGIQWAVENGMRVVNMSLGTSSDSTTLREAVDAAYANGTGVLLVAAAGNSGNRAGKGDNINYPAKYASVIAVGATDSSDKRASFSSTGPALELMAPGVSIPSTLPGNSYGSYSGTSMATPHVSGAAALVMAANPDWTAGQVRDRLNATAEKIGDDPNKYGNGLVNVASALGVTPVPGGALSVAVATDKSSYKIGETVYITVTVTDGSSPVADASVTVTVLTASGKAYSGSGTTGSDGVVRFRYKIRSSDGKGTYTVTADASKTGYESGTGSTTFLVQ